MKTALLIVDVQNDFCPPDGSLQVPGGLEIIEPINAIRKRVNWDVVVLTQDWHPSNHISFCSNNLQKPKGAAEDWKPPEVFKPHRLSRGSIQMMWPDHCVQNSHGSNIHENLDWNPDVDIVVRKGTDQNIDSYSGFFDNDHKCQTELHSVLQKHEISRVVCVGLAYDYCVAFTAIDAVDLGYETCILEDCTRPVAKDSMERMKEKLIEKGVKILQSGNIGDDCSW